MTARAPAAESKPRLTLADVNGDDCDQLVRLELPNGIELRIDGALVWSCSGQDLLPGGVYGAGVAVLQLKVVHMTDAEVAAIPET